MIFLFYKVYKLCLLVLNSFMLIWQLLICLLLLILVWRHKLQNVVLQVVLQVFIICRHFQNYKIVDRLNWAYKIVCTSWHFKSIAMLSLKRWFSPLVQLTYFRLLRLSPILERSFFLSLVFMINRTTVFLENLTEI